MVNLKLVTIFLPSQNYHRKRDQLTSFLLLIRKIQATPWNIEERFVLSFLFPYKRVIKNPNPTSLSALHVSDLAAVRLSLPANLLEPIGNLEYWTYCDRADFFAALNEPEDELDRMLAVLRWTFTKDLKFVKAKIAKPYNSILLVLTFFFLSPSTQRRRPFY